MKNTVLRKIIRILTIVLMVAIFVLSSRPIEVSRQDSARAMKLFGFVAEYEDALNMSDLSMLSIHNALRKFAHELIFGVLGILLFLSIYRLGRVWKSAGIALLISALYGASDEFHQIFSHRGAMVSDVVRDSIGALIGITLVVIFFLIVEKNRKMKNFINIFYDLSKPGESLEAVDVKNN